MSIFVKDELVSPTLRTSSIVFDYDYKDLSTVLLNVRRVVRELLAVLRTPKGFIFKHRELGSTLYQYEFGSLLEERGGLLVEELKRDIESQVSGVTVKNVSFTINETFKVLEVNMTIEVEGKTYILPSISLRM